MNLGMVRGMLEQVSRHKSSRSPASEASQDDSSSNCSMAMQPSQVSTESSSPSHSKPLSNAAMLARARAAHKRVDFSALAAGPNTGGPWKRVEAAGRFVLFRAVAVTAGPQVLCAGRLDAAIEELSSLLCTHSETEHNAAMTALHDRRFLCGSLERNVPCYGAVDNQEEPAPRDDGEHLTVKTSSFARSSLFGCNEQWCYTDYFQRKAERDGFTLSLNSLGRSEPTPARITGTQPRVDQLHDLTASYLVDLDPGSHGLRVVFNAQFLSHGVSCQSGSSASHKASSDTDVRAQTRRLVLLARAVTKLPELVRCRRFGFQIPADLDAIRVSNPRCPCCTRSLSPVKMSLSVAAAAISTRSLASLKTDTRRCYLCGYLVCINCWSGERMENRSGRVAAIVVCRRCQASVDACDYSDISVDRDHGPARVVEDPPESSTASLLLDFLADSLAQAPAGSAMRSSVFAVVRTLLHPDEDTSDDLDVATIEQQWDAQAVAKVDQFLRDERTFPLLAACKLGNAQRRSYVLDLPEDPENSVPRGPIPSNEGRRLSAASSAGLLLLADQVAPSEPHGAKPDQHVDVRDLELICQLAAKTLGCSNAMLSVMSASHEHVLASTDSNFAGVAVPRDYTMCQHQLMSQDPLVLLHPEADVRLQAVQSVKLMSLRSYVGFPVMAPMLDGSNTLHNNEIAVGTLCCIDSKPHHELTRSQYATMQNLARTASRLMQLKGLQLQQRAAALS